MRRNINGLVHAFQGVSLVRLGTFRKRYGPAGKSFPDSGVVFRATVENVKLSADVFSVTMGLLNSFEKYPWHFCACIGLQDPGIVAVIQKHDGLRVFGIGANTQKKSG